MKRKLTSILITLTISMSSLTPILGADTRVNLLIDGVTVETDQPAVIYNGRTMVPLRVITNSMGLNAQWDAETKTVAISEDKSSGMYMYLTVGVNKIFAEDKNSGETGSVDIDTAPIIMNGRLMLPVAIISDVLGCTAQWDAETKTVNIITISENSTVLNEYSDEYRTLMEATDEIFYEIGDNLDSLTDEQVSKYLEISDKYYDLPSYFSQDVTSEDLENLKKLSSEIKEFSYSIDIKNQAEFSVKYLSSGEYNVLAGAKDDGNIDSKKADELIAEFNKYVSAIEKSEDKSSDEYSIFSSYILAGKEGISNFMESGYTYDISQVQNAAYGIAAVAEAFDINIDEELKEYDVEVTNSLYFSSDKSELNNALSEALIKSMDYKSAIKENIDTFSQKNEFSRISGVYSYYCYKELNSIETIDIMIKKLKILDVQNVRLEIFAKKYGISL